MHRHATAHHNFYRTEGGIMIFTTESGDTFEVRNTSSGATEIRQSPDFFAIGPLPLEATFLPVEFIESPHVGKTCHFKLLTAPEGFADTYTTDPVVHIQYR